MLSQNNIEIWGSVVGYESNYDVSTLGRVRSLDRKRKCKNGCFRLVKGKILTGKIERHGYRSVVLSMNGFEKRFYIHKLVADTFISRDNSLDVNHINGVKSDNNILNLERCTRSENIRHAIRIGLFKPFIKTKK